MSDDKKDKDKKPAKPKKSKVKKLPIPIEEKKISQTEKVWTLVQATQNKGDLPFKKWNHKFHVVETEDERRLWIEEKKQGVCHFVGEHVIIQRLHKYTTDITFMRYGSTYQFDMRGLKELEQKMLNEYEPVPYPTAVNFRKDKGLCFNRLPWDYDEPGFSPLFNELMRRTSNAEALMCFIGSLFFEESDQQQYVWLYGTGKNGKGSLARFLKKCFGQACAGGLQIPRMDDKFWTASLIGKRLGIFPDANNAKFVRSSLFKSLTGEDTISIERKFKESVDVKLNTKFIFISNNKPDIVDEVSDMRRVIYCEVKPIEETFNRYEDVLWEEGGRFLSDCIQLYRKKVRQHGTIPTDTSQIAEIATANDDDYESIVEASLDVGSPTFRCKASHLVRIAKAHGVRGHEYKKFIKFLVRKYGCEAKKIRDGREQYRIYTNIKTKRNFEIEF